MISQKNYQLHYLAKTKQRWFRVVLLRSIASLLLFYSWLFWRIPKSNFLCLASSFMIGCCNLKITLGEEGACLKIQLNYRVCTLLFLGAGKILDVGQPAGCMNKKTEKLDITRRKIQYCWKEIHDNATSDEPETSLWLAYIQPEGENIWWSTLVFEVYSVQSQQWSLLLHMQFCSGACSFPELLVIICMLAVMVVMVIVVFSKAYWHIINLEFQQDT